MTRNENQMYSDISSIAKSLEKIANALDTPNVVYNGELKNTKDIPGFEGTLDALDVLTDIKTITDEYASNKEEDDTIHNDYLNDLIQDMNHTEYLNFHHDMDFGFASSDAAALTNHIYDLEYEEVLDCIKSALLITGDSDYVKAVECSEFDMERKDELAREYVIDLVKKENTTNDPYTYDNDLNEYVDNVINDSDHDIRSTANFYEIEYIEKHGATKKECILDYVTNEFGALGARYTDIIKFAYYLGAHNAPKYTSENRGYYSLAFSKRQGGYLIKGGKDCLVKGINKEGDERYFAFSFVEQATDYWKYVDDRSAR